MTDLIKVSPQIIDEIEFYVSADGKECGVSKNGLARLCGVARSTIYELLERLDIPTVRTSKPIPECLKETVGKVYLKSVISSNGAHIVSSDTASCVIEYYAFD
jgi:DNA-binding XRE family transcriptional regulator